MFIGGDSELETVGDRIRILRKLKNLNQTKFGKKLNVKTSTVAGWENNFRSVGERTLNDIARIYGVSKLWLETGHGEMFIQQDILIVEKIDDIMSGENEFRKKLIKSIVNFNDDEILLLEKIVNELSTNKKTD